MRDTNLTPAEAVDILEGNLMPIAKVLDQDIASGLMVRMSSLLLAWKGQTCKDRISARLLAFVGQPSKEAVKDLAQGLKEMVHVDPELHKELQEHTPAFLMAR